MEEKIEVENGKDSAPKNEIDSNGYEKVLKIGSIISLLIILIIGLVVYLKHNSKSTIVYSTEKQVIENKIGSKTRTPFEKSEKEVLNKIKPSGKEKVELIDVIQTDISQNGLVTIFNQNKVVDEITTRPSDDNLKKIDSKNTNTRKASNCDNLITERISIVASCENESNGIIEVNQIQGGKSPYLVQLNNGHFGVDHPKFTSLPSGTYIITIIDENKCKKEIKDVLLPYKECEEVVNQHHIYVNNDYLISLKDLKWHIPNCPTKAYLEIRSKQGEHVFGAEFRKDINEVWHLQNQHGHLVNVGVYVYSIKNLDSNELVTGSLTITE